MDDIFQWVSLGISVLTAIVVPIAGSMLRGLRNDMSAANEQTKESFRAYAQHVDEKLDRLSRHVDALMMRIADSERKSSELQIQIAQRETEYTRRFAHADELRDVAAKIDRLIEFITRVQKETMERQSACRDNCVSKEGKPA
jgi:chromosome segregation ATPase